MGKPGDRERSGAEARLSVVQYVTEGALLRLEPEESLLEMLERVRAGLGADAATLRRLVPATDSAPATLHHHASVGMDPAVGPAVDLPLGSGLAGRVAERVEPLLVADIPADGRASPHLTAHGMKSMAGVPLTMAGSCIGVLHVTSRQQAAFSNDDVSLLQLLADRVAMAVERVNAAERDRASAAALRASERRNRAVLDTAVDGILTIDSSGLVQSMNPAAERMFQFTADDVVGNNVKMLMPEPFRSQHDQYLDRYRRTGERRIIGIGREVLGRRRDGSTFPLELAVSEFEVDGARLFTGVVRDITERKQFEEQLAHNALHDPLTGLGNRNLLVERMTHALARMQRQPGLLALLFIDLDRFKQVNDTLGHASGDRLLVEIAQRLATAVRPMDSVVRLGGDEFVVLCEDIRSTKGAERVAKRVIDVIGLPVSLDNRRVFVSGSVGIVTADHTADAVGVLRDADAAMYQAKANGRGRYAFFDDALSAESRDRFNLVGELPRALEREELRVLYQPLVDLVSGEVVGAEALVRWEHPERGLLAPAAFLKVAEDSGLIWDVDAWVLRTARRDAAGWSRRLGRQLQVWVNVSACSFTDDRLVGLIREVIAEDEWTNGSLCLEITEGAAMGDVTSTLPTLTALRELGVRLAIDDFGTGYSSMAYLQRFTVNALKIDRSFVSHLGHLVEWTDDSTSAIVRAMISLAESLKLEAVAEGIETPTQLAAVTALGCTLGQGSFLGRPTTSDEILIAASSGMTLPRDLVDQGMAELLHPAG